MSGYGQENKNFNLKTKMTICQRCVIKEKNRLDVL